VVAHNTWQKMGSPSVISLTKDTLGNYTSKGTLKIVDFVLHPQISLILKLEY